MILEEAGRTQDALDNCIKLEKERVENPDGGIVDGLFLYERKADLLFKLDRFEESEAG